MLVTKMEDDVVAIHNLPEFYDVAQDLNQVTFKHVQDVSRIMEQVKVIKEDTDNGFSKERNFQWVGRIPALVYASHPEFLTDPESIDRFLRSDEGAPYRIAKGIASPMFPGKRVMTIAPGGKVTIHA